MIGESLKEEVDINNEWSRLAFSINRLSGGSKKKVFLRLVSYAAAMFIGVVLSISAFYFVEKKPLAMVGTYKLVTDKGEKSYLQLPDGTNVWLNSCTTIEYAPDYGKSNRDIHLDGEAYFEVAKNKELPFIVKTSGGIDVKAVGTAFNVLAYSDDAKLITTLFSGKVVVQPTLTKQQILLEPNQVAVYYKGRNKIEIVPYDKKMFAQWRGGALSFEMMYLEDITKLLERNYNVVFRYQNQKIKKLKFSGSFRNSEDLSEILRVIKTNTSITYQVVKDTIIIK